MKGYYAPSIDMIRAICGSMEKWLHLSTSSAKKIFGNYSGMCALCYYEKSMRERALKDRIFTNYCELCPIGMVSGDGCDATPWVEIERLNNSLENFDYENGASIKDYTLAEYEFLVDLFFYTVECYREGKRIDRDEFEKYRLTSE